MNYLDFFKSGNKIRKHEEGDEVTEQSSDILTADEWQNQYDSEEAREARKLNLITLGKQYMNELNTLAYGKRKEAMELLKSHPDNYYTLNGGVTYKNRFGKTHYKYNKKDLRNRLSEQYTDEDLYNIGSNVVSKLKWDKSNIYNLLYPDVYDLDVDVNSKSNLGLSNDNEFYESAASVTPTQYPNSGNRTIIMNGNTYPNTFTTQTGWIVTDPTTEQSYSKDWDLEGYNAALLNYNKEYDRITNLDINTTLQIINSYKK